ncbi:hypothetical protein EVAR_48154_1 [Eumeta japonica]|uniref:Uncharacterized protein n=1 Tax=Eumeta variegata TaxID=151549 RepID=A0A4C1WS69_EUMVA|nr:hypothetical protein EVAR_48154_1 [Eumeta japonica]
MILLTYSSILLHPSRLVVHKSHSSLTRCVSPESSKALANLSNTAFPEVAFRVNSDASFKFDRVPELLMLQRRSRYKPIDFPSSSPYIIPFLPFAFSATCDEETCSECGDAATGARARGAGESHSDREPSTERVS